MQSPSHRYDMSHSEVHTSISVPTSYGYSVLHYQIYICLGVHSTVFGSFDQRDIIIICCVVMYSVTALPFSRSFINSSQAFYINTYIILHESPKCQNTIVTLLLHLPHEVQGFVESHGSKKASLFRVPSRVRVVGPACRRCQIRLHM